MSRIVPVYIDLDTGNFTVKSTEIDSRFKVYLFDVVDAANQWVINHSQGTKSVLIKMYKVLHEGVPSITPTPTPVVPANPFIDTVYEEIFP